MTIPAPTRFWKLNNSRLDEIAQHQLTSGQGNDHYVDPGKAGQAWNLGTTATSYKLYAHLIPGPGTGSFTLSLWLRIHTTSSLSNRKICSSGGGNVLLAELRYSRNFLGAQTISAHTKTKSSAAIPYGTNDTTWHHIAIRHDTDTEENSVWLDGAKTTFTWEPTDNFENFSIALAAAYTTSQSLLPAEVDAVAWWNEALSDANLADLATYPEDWPTEEPSTIRPWPIWRWLDLATRLSQQSESEDLLYDDPDTLLEDLTTCQAVLTEQFDLDPTERWYWSLRSALLHTLANTARFATDANLGPLTEANPDQRFDPQTSFNLWGAWATATQDPDDRYDEAPNYLADLADKLASLDILLPVTPAERDRDAILTALDTIGNLTTLFLADTQLMR